MLIWPQNPDIFGRGGSFLPAAKPSGHGTVRVVVVVAVVVVLVVVVGGGLL